VKKISVVSRRLHVVNEAQGNLLFYDAIHNPGRRLWRLVERSLARSLATNPNSSHTLIKWASMLIEQAIRIEFNKTGLQLYARHLNQAGEKLTDASRIGKARWEVPFYEAFILLLR
jgi:hypothetical protein